MSEGKTEGRLIVELEKLLDSLPDDAARQRVLEWAQNRWAPKTGSEQLPKFSISGDVGGKLQEPTVTRLVGQMIPTPARSGLTVCSGATFLDGSHSIAVGTLGLGSGASLQS
jgi:hypothetical protein